MTTWNVLVDNGYRFEYHSQVEGDTPMQARKRFLAEHNGAWYAQPKMVRVTRTAPAAPAVDPKNPIESEPALSVI